MLNTNCKNIDYCYYCYYCYYCNSCNSCDYCYYCNSCYSCDYCDYCKNLKMTEYNTFCYSEDYDDKKSFQQPRFRVFNTEVEKYKYLEIKKEINGILSGLKLELDKKSWQKEWEKVTPEQWQKLMELAKEVRGDDFRKGFEFISEVEISQERNNEDDYAYDKNGNIIGKIVEGKIIQRS